MSLLAALIGGEVALRSYHWLHNRTPFIMTSSDNPHRPVITLDEERGWRATENIRIEKVVKSADGSEYPLALSQNEHGFRLFGEISSVGARRPRVLVIGDSYTHAIEVSDSRTYYAILKDSIGAEVFAYGVGGYGTLQEYMVLAKYFTMIRPDLIIWQYSPNDITNNSVVLESRSLLNNNGMRRPYLRGGRIEYVLPKPRSRLIREYATKYSRFLYFILSRVDRIRAANSPGQLERDIETRGLDLPEFADAVQVTDQIMGDVRRLIGDVPMVGFAGQPGLTQRVFADISAKHGIDFVMGVGDTLRAAQQRGVVLTAADGAHWNEAGHRIVAGLILAAIKERCLLDSCRGTRP